MNFSISNLPFTGFKANALSKLSQKYSIEIFNEFGDDIYWETIISNLNPNSALSVHAPCVSINLANPDDKNCIQVYEKTIEFAAKYKAEFVVLHSNESWTGNPIEIKEIIENRIESIVNIGNKHNIQILIENVGLRTNNSLIYDWDEYLNLLNKFPSCKALLDTGHAHINNWDIPELIHTLKDRIVAIHLHDNDQKSDQHLPIGMGNINWHKVFKAIKEEIPEVALVLEYSTFEISEVDAHIQSLKSKYNL